MEALSQLLSRARNGDFISGFRVGGRGSEGLFMSHLLFADDTLIFCDADADQLQYLSWTFMWFEAISKLKVNLSKTEVILVGEGIPMETLAAVLGCKIGSLPTSYLGLPLRAPYKSTRVWDAVEERFKKRQYLSKGGRLTLLKSTLSSLPTYFLSLFVIPKRVCVRLENIQRDFLWGGGALENKPHLVSWKVVCTDKKEGGLGIRSLATFNKALLGKWLWRFANENESYGSKLSLAIRKGWENFRSHSRFIIGDGTRVKFWKDLWYGNQSLEEAFPMLFNLSVNKEGWVAEAWEEDEGGEEVWRTCSGGKRTRMEPFLSSPFIAHSQGTPSPPSRLELFGRLGSQLGLASLFGRWLGAGNHRSPSSVLRESQNVMASNLLPVWGAMGDALLGEKKPPRLAWFLCGQEKGESLESCPSLLDVDHLERKK
ncbi:putative ribonuclease H protein [Vitis vinifera]|uniref:Putative ribonuclease H protein n=1 Tax=Vitis vinifera TaxID=29760 RepID=A0A438DSH5_VITVI|nr:putative ribonuclease H protein [Vitis vinifera]